MLILKNKFHILFLLFFLLSGTPALADNPTPEETVKSLLGAIQKIKKGNNLSARQKGINKESSEVALAKMSIPGVGRKTLGKHWKKRTPEEQKTFLKLLSKLFKEIAFPNSGKFFADLDIVYGESEVEKVRAVVPLTVIHKDEGEVDIGFILNKVDNKWLVVEVLLDGISMRNNLRSQFYKVISKKGYQELIQRITRKLKKTEANG